jgi:hypothetical protein
MEKKSQNYRLPKLKTPQIIARAKINFPAINKAT